MQLSDSEFKVEWKASNTALPSMHRPSKQADIVFEDILAAKEANQLIIVAPGNSVSAKRVTAGFGATQVLGQMSDAALQQLSQARKD